MDNPPTPPQKTYHSPKTIEVRSDTSLSFEDNGLKNKQPAGRSIQMPLPVRTSKGRVQETEIWPKPSISELDPLNWSSPKKNLHLTSLLLLTATSCVLKTLLVTVAAPLATEFSISYLQAASFTGVPYIFAALSAVGSEVLAKVVGKRGLLLGAAVLMLVSSLGNMHVQTYGEFLFTRILQGVGWGVVDSLVTLCIEDVFFIHQRPLRLHLQHLTSFTFTYGTPILGGWLSQGLEGFGLQIMILNIVQSLSILLLIFCTPESTFSRSSSPKPNLPTSSSSLNTQITTSHPSPSAIKTYLKTLHPMPFFAKPGIKEFMIPLKMLIIPSTLLTTSITALLPASALAVSNSLSLLFASIPIFLFPSRIGYLFILPLCLGLITYTLTAVITTYTRSFKTLKTLMRILRIATPGMVIGVTGLLGFGIYVLGNLKQREKDQITMFNLDVTGENMSLRIVSLLFGILVSGVVLMDFSTFSASSPSPQKKVVAGVQRGVNIHQGILTGLLILIFPPVIQTIATRFSGLKVLVVVLSVLQFVLGSTGLAIFWMKGESVRRVDSRVLGVGYEERGELGMVKGMEGSWMEA